MVMVNPSIKNNLGSDSICRLFIYIYYVLNVRNHNCLRLEHCTQTHQK